MKTTYCPLCHSKLEVRDVAPCAACGHLAVEIEHAQLNRHTYAEMRLFGQLYIILCDFCQVDFGSQSPEYFGLRTPELLRFDRMECIKVANNIITQDKWCPQCEYRLAFLTFVAEARILHERHSGQAG